MIITSSHQQILKVSALMSVMPAMGCIHHFIGKAKGNDILALPWVVC